MVNSCCAVGCTTRFVKGAGISFFKFPINEVRYSLWARAIKRKNWKPSPYSVICGKHFQTGKPSTDSQHPDFVPNVFSYKATSRSAIRYENCKTRCQKRSSERTNNDEYEVASSLLQLEECIPGNVAEQSAENIDTQEYNIFNVENLHKVEHKEVQVQTSVSTALEMHALREEVRNLKNQLLSFDFSSLVLNNKSKLKYYTGLPNVETLNWILSSTQEFVRSNFDISSQNQILIVFVKLRLNLQNEDIADRFKISRRTVKRIFEAWLPALAGRLRHLIFWPNEENRRKKLPKCFRNSTYKDAVCTIDCTEIFTQRPSNMKTKNQMWSNYKHHLTIKVLVGITPQGLVCFVSNSWGGRVSDKELTLKSGILKKLKPGDVILADRGFNVQKEFSVKGVNLIVPSYTKKKKQLSYKEVLRSKRISNVRIHVERVIGCLKKFQILNSTLPITLLKYIDCILSVCAAIHNLNPTIVP